MADNADVLQRVNEELTLLGITGANIELVPTSIELAEPGDPVTVRVRIDLDAISAVPGIFDFAVTDIVAESSMRRESTE